MGSKKKRGFLRNPASQIRHKTQIRKILKGFVKKKIILNYKKENSILENGISYRIFFFKDRSFSLKIYKPKSLFQSSCSVTKRNSVEAIIFLSEEYRPKDIVRLIKSEIEERTYGLKKEAKFKEEMEILISKDKEVSKLITKVECPKKMEEDCTLGIDFYFILKNNKRVPLQLKSGKTYQAIHRINHSEIPSLVYKKGDLENGFLKKKVMDIVSDYIKLNYSKHI